ncbi:Biogenesis of lysosome-related organelles complex 1 subunit 1 [Atta colombica]|uniref:Biogenesis of lysosome-related organelles complex 1 subunit 1 n=1 Tax=Atta colombica TaxID=520822 RepID=A0A195BCK4_9HYME|nr:Biogenesis of lysosome-related organelles complex 1 subunit 1 [Atta colombica]
MLSAIVKEHQSKQAVRKERQEQKRKEAVQAASNLTQALVDHLNVGVAQAYLNQKKLDAEAKQLQHSATNFAKQTQLWLNLVESFSSSLKEIGDAENWARSIEGDMRTIATALEYSYKASEYNWLLFKNPTNRIQSLDEHASNFFSGLKAPIGRVQDGKAACRANEFNLKSVTGSYNHGMSLTSDEVVLDNN